MPRDYTGRHFILMICSRRCIVQLVHAGSNTMNVNKPRVASSKKKSVVAKPKAAKKPNLGGSFAKKGSQQGNKKAPVSQGNVRLVREPAYLERNSNGDITVEHEEFVADIAGSVAFSNTLYPVNPGLASTFPWLSQMAPLYESYIFERLEFRYENQTSTTTVGAVMLAVDYDASDPAAVSKTQLATYRGYIRGPPWSEFSNLSSREDLRKRSSYYVRSGVLSADQDVKLYDTGNLNVATSRQIDTSFIGELYVRYRVKLMTPQLTSNGLGLALSAKYAATVESGIPVANASSNVPLTVSGTAAAATYTSTGPYQALVDVGIIGTTLTGTAYTGTATITEFSPDPINAAATQERSCAVVNFTASGQTLIVTVGAATITAYNARFGNYNASLA